MVSGSPRLTFTSSYTYLLIDFFSLNCHAYPQKCMFFTNLDWWSCMRPRTPNATNFCGQKCMLYIQKSMHVLMNMPHLEKNLTLTCAYSISRSYMQVQIIIRCTSLNIILKTISFLCSTI